MREQKHILQAWLPTSLWGRGALVLLLVGGGFALLIAHDFLVPHREPIQADDDRLLLRARIALTKPLTTAINNFIERRIRRRAEAPLMHTGLSLEQTIALFQDDSIPFGDRRNYAYRLARQGSAECLATLKRVLPRLDPEGRASIAQLIGLTGNQKINPLLSSLLEDPDLRVQLGAIRGLCLLGGEDVTSRMGELLTDPGQNEAIRVEAAVGLGVLGTGTARDMLHNALGNTASAELTTQVLNSLGKFPFEEVNGAFDEVLSAPKTLPALRVRAVEALANSSEDAVPFLLEHASSDSDANVRASAAWALSNHDTVHHLAADLVNLAEREPEADVRRRLYEALLPQEAIPADRLLSLVRSETDVAARVAGFNALGCAANQAKGSSAAAVFDQEIVPELFQQALAPNSVNIQMRCVFALRRAQTPAAQAALAEIAAHAAPQIAIAARNGLRTPKI